MMFQVLALEEPDVRVLNYAPGEEGRSATAIHFSLALWMLWFEAGLDTR